MLLTPIPSTVYGENCYVLSAGSTAVVIDPGVGTAGAITAYLAAEKLILAAVLLTHGHPDHVWEAGCVAGSLPVFIAEPDRYRLEALSDHISPTGGFFRDLAGSDPAQIENLQLFPAAAFSSSWMVAPGISVRVVPAPGHTEGSVLLLFAPPAGELTVQTWEGPCPAGQGNSAIAAGETYAFCGDVIFAGSVGRTDLPGGDAAVMEATLRTLRVSLDPQLVLLPGHGPATTMAAELATNPHLQFRS